MKRSAFPNLRTIAIPSWYNCCKFRGPPGKLEPRMMRRPSNPQHQHHLKSKKFKRNQINKGNRRAMKNAEILI
jgi:hypothetical protein